MTINTEYIDALDAKNFARYVKAMAKTVHIHGQFGELHQVINHFRGEVLGKTEMGGKYYLQINDDRLIPVPKMHYEATIIKDN